MKLRYIISAKVLWFWLKYWHDFIDADWHYWYQCVDLIRRYVEEMFWYKRIPVDYAVNISYKNLTADKWEELKVGVDDLNRGDIVTVRKNKKDNIGHVFIVWSQTTDGIHYIDQNWIWGAGNKLPNGQYPQIKGNGVEKRFMKWGDWQLVRAFRYKG